LANSVDAIVQGFDYQARFFWVHAAALRSRDHENVVEVSYEADDLRAFDDVVVRYDPPRRSSGPYGVAVDYHQIKFHVVADSFGYENLIDPKFSGGTAVSILQRLAAAKAKAPPNAAFTVVTTDRIKDGDPLLALKSNVDSALRLDKLFVEGGDQSRMGKVRKLWREHLELADDPALRAVLEGFHIFDNHKSLEAMRDEVNERFRVVGLVTDNQSIEFRFDAVARQLKVKRINVLTRESFEKLCVAEKWIRVGDGDNYLNVALRSFSDGVAADLDAGADNTLSLLGDFDGRRLAEGSDWTRDIVAKVRPFLESVRNRGRSVRLYLNVHASIAFLAGTILGLKSGVDTELVQRTQTKLLIWRADDGQSGPDLNIATTEIPGGGDDIAVVVSLTWDAATDVIDYVVGNVPSVGRLIQGLPEGGPGQSSVLGGAHAAAMAYQIGSAVREARPPLGSTIHIFVAGPNAFTFFLGQHRGVMGSVMLYEFDFERRHNASYQPSFRID
jgi:hypothetical protein